jgi:type IV pilus assembly protein PilN
MRIVLNLATRPFTDLGPALKRLRIAMGALAVVSIGLWLGLHALHQKAERARAREHSLDGAIARITQERQGYMAFMHEPANARLLAQIGMLNKLFDEKSFSWTLAMENLETALPGGVQVTTLEPVRAKDGHITLHLQVAGPYDLAVDLVRNLEHSSRFLDPQIVDENAEASSGPNQRLEPVSATNRFNFDLLAEYNPPTPEEERKAAQGATQSTEKKPAAGTGDAGNPPGPARRVPVLARRMGRPPYTGPSQPKPTPAGNLTPGGPQ